MSTLSDAYLADVRRMFANYKALGEKAMAQLDDAQLFVTLDPESNSVALVVKHLAGNMRSRFTDFLTSDGEKPGRNRDGEFELQGPATRAEVEAWWENGWRTVFAALETVGPDKVLDTVHVRGEPLTVMQALDRQVAHYAYHVGQIVFLAKHLASERWRSLSIPRGQSARYATGTYREGIVPKPPGERR